MCVLGDEEISSSCISNDEILIFHPKKTHRKEKLSYYFEHLTQHVEITVFLYETKRAS